MRTTRRAAATIVVVALSALASAVTQGAGAEPTSATASAATVPAEQAATWLLSQFDATTHLIPSPFVAGSPDPGATVQAAANLELTGVGHSAASAAVTALAPSVDLFVKDGTGHDKPGSLARLILAVIATGGDPHSYGGFDLVSRLGSTIQTTGTDAGLFGTQDATYDGAFRQGLSLAALSMVIPKPASIDPGAGSINDLPAVAWLRLQQCADGSWMPHRTDLTVACAPDFVNFTGPDTNSTALAAIGLRAVATSAPISPTAYFNTLRHADGGWGFDGNPTSVTDPDSTGLVMAALRALGSTPDAAASTALRSFQLGDSAPPADQGAFYYPPYAPTDPLTPNLQSTNDAILGLSNGIWPAVLADPPTPIVTPTTTLSPTTTSSPTTTGAPTTTTIGIQIGDAVSVTRPLDTVDVLGKATSRTSGDLAATGANALLLVALGSGLVAAGSVIVLARRRRSQ